jgi:cytochrome c
MRNSGLVWDSASLDTYLTNPQKMVPGGKMSFAGLKDSKDRKAVIDYLAMLKADAQPQ